MGKSELLLSHMHSFAGDESITQEEMSEFAKNGVSKERIKTAIKDSCKCKARCGKRIGFAHVVAAATLFWSLPKGGQDSILWALQVGHLDSEDQDVDEDSDGSSSSSESRSQTRSRTPRRTMNKWFIEGRRKNREEQFF